MVARGLAAPGFQALSSGQGGLQSLWRKETVRRNVDPTATRSLGSKRRLRGALTPQDVEYARELGYIIKHLGIAKQNGAGVELRVHPTLIPDHRLLADVDGVKNAILVEGNAVGPTLYYGAGAGGAPTASAVVADLVDLARDLGAGQTCRVPPLGFARERLRDLPVIPMADVQTPWYLRMEVEDKPGVLSAVASIFSEQGI